MRIGIIGTGRIAKRFVADARHVDAVSIVGVYNPKADSARTFAREQGIEISYSNLEEFLTVVDAIYIASPHGTHYSYAKKAIEVGKHVLCEKPMCLSRQQAQELFDLAGKYQVVLQEAIKTAYFPGFQKLVEVAKSGIIGDIVDVEACFTKIEPKTGREFADLQNGGSVTELASYVLLPILKLLGTNYSDLQFMSIKDENGVDTYTKILLDYGRQMALGKVGLAAKSEGELLVAGTDGYIYCQAPWWLTKHFEIRDINGQTKEVFNFEIQGSGLQYELEAFVNRAQGIEPSAMTVEESLTSIAIIEEFLKTR